MKLRIARVNFRDARDAQALVMLLDAYARDPMGGGQGLTEAVKARVCNELAEHPGATSFMAWQGAGASAQAIGLINCFTGYSTFKAQPLLNIHDIVVLPAQRGQGVGQALLAAAQAHALELGCCKLTLEVLTGNTRALASYQRFGFAPYTLDPSSGEASFMHKWLSQGD
jgi:ribosomal protein S18 acetylase RimI-like enzyme